MKFFINFLALSFVFFTPLEMSATFPKRKLSGNSLGIQDYKKRSYWRGSRPASIQSSVRRSPVVSEEKQNKNNWLFREMIALELAELPERPLAPAPTEKTAIKSLLGGVVSQQGKEVGFLSTRGRVVHERVLRGIAQEKAIEAQACGEELAWTPKQWDCDENGVPRWAQDKNEAE